VVEGRLAEGPAADAGRVRGARAHTAPVAPSAARLLALQRTAGNRAVGSMLRARTLQREPMLHDWDKPERAVRQIYRDNEVLNEVYNVYERTIDAATLNYYQLDDWIQRAKSHPEADAKLLKQVRSLRKRKRPTRDAREVIGAFEGATGALAFRVTRKDVADHLRLVLLRPELLQQGGYGLCGPDAFVRAIAMRHPNEYVDYVIDLATTGVGHIGGLRVCATDDVRAERFTPGQPKHRIAAADWIALASLRSDKNTLYSAIHHMDRRWYEGIQWIHAGIGAGTDVDELRDWAREVGLSDDRIEMRMKHVALITNVIGQSRNDAFSANWDRIEELRSQGWDVMLAIHQKVIGNARELPRFVVGGHFVLLTGPIRAEQKNAVAGRGFDAMTWGGIKHGWFADTDASIALIGYLALDLRRPLRRLAEVREREAKYVFSRPFPEPELGPEDKGKGPRRLLELE